MSTRGVEGVMAREWVGAESLAGAIAAIAKNEAAITHCALFISAIKPDVTLLGLKATIQMTKSLRFRKTRRKSC